jgi:hypothetical protein
VYLLENPVLQRELLVNLRMLRGFVLLFFYVGALGAVVYAILLMYALPLAVDWFARVPFPASVATAWIHGLTCTSPFAAAFSLPLQVG